MIENVEVLGDSWQFSFAILLAGFFGVFRPEVELLCAIVVGRDAVPFRVNAFRMKSADSARLLGPFLADGAEVRSHRVVNEASGQINQHHSRPPGF